MDSPVDVGSPGGAGPPGRVAVPVADGHLATPLVAALTARGWVLADPPDGAPAVLLEDAGGRLHLDHVRVAVRRGARVVVVGGPRHRLVLARALDLGATDAVESTLPIDEVLAAVESALRGRRPGAVTATDRARGLRRRAVEAARFAALTDRECEVLAAIASGASVTQVARHRPVAVSTVRSQVAAVLLKLEAPSQTAAVAMTYRSCHDPRIRAALRHHHDDG